MNSRSQATREIILEAAYKLFSEKGFDKTTTKEIAEESNVAELTLFRHFKNKYNLFQQVLFRYSPVYDLEGVISELEDLPVQEGLLHLTQLLVRSLKRNRNIIRLNLMTKTNDEELKSAIKPVRKKLLELILDYFRKKDIGKAIDVGFSVEEAAQAYLWFIFSSVIHFEKEKMDVMKVPPDRMCEVFCRIFLNGLDF